MKHRYRGSREEAGVLSAYVKLMRASNSITDRIHRHLGGAGLTISQFGVLEALYHLGPMIQVEIGSKILRSRGNITMVIDNLEKRSLVRRERSRQDRRYFTMHLTKIGEALISGLFPIHAARIREEMRVPTPSEQEELGRLCRKLGLGKEKKT